MHPRQTTLSIFILQSYVDNNNRYISCPGGNDTYIAGRLSCDEAGQIRPSLLYRPYNATTFDGAVRGYPPGSV